MVTQSLWPQCAIVGLLHKSTPVADMPYKQAPRKSVGTSSRSGQRPLHCVYAATATRRNTSEPQVRKSNSSSGLSSDEKSDDENQLTTVPLSKACADSGIVPSDNITLDLEPATVRALSNLTTCAGPDWPGVQQISHKWPQKVSLATEATREGVFVPLAMQALGEMELVGCMAGTLQEKVGMSYCRSTQ